MNRNNPISLLRKFLVNIDKILRGGLSGVGMHRVMCQPLIKLVLTDVHPVTVDLLPKSQIYRHYSNPQLLN